MSVTSEWRMAWQGRGGHAYDEAAFRRLLARERLRSRGAHPVVLVLVELTSPARPDGALVARLFSALSSAVRETDIVGWYRRDHVAAVVLTETSAASAAEAARLVGARVAASLERRLATSLAHRVRIRIHSNGRLVAAIAAATGPAPREDQ